MRSSSFNGNNFLFVFMILLIIGLTGVVIWMGLSNPQSSTTEPTLPALVQSRAKVSNDYASYISVTGQNIEIHPDDVIVKIPDEAINTKGFLSIIKREAEMFPDAGEPGWNRPNIANIEFLDDLEQRIERFEFEKPIEICFVLDNETWKDFIHNRDYYQVQIFIEEPANWVSLPITFNYDRHELCGISKRLSLFALAINGEPQATGTPTKIYEP